MQGSGCDGVLSRYVFLKYPSLRSAKKRYLLLAVHFSSSKLVNIYLFCYKMRNILAPHVCGVYVSQ